MSRSGDHFYKNGLRAGYVEYRYGTAKPVTLAGRKGSPPVLKSGRRDHLIHRVIDLMKDWTLSQFEHEAPAKQGLRQALCLEGIRWARADLAACDVVDEAIRRIGAKRPNWIEGQLYYSTSPDFCSWCLGPIDGDHSRAQRFCSTVCASAALEHRAGSDLRYTDAVQRSAKRLIAREAAEPQHCAYCDRIFRTDAPGQRYCSNACASRDQKGDRLLSEIACAACGMIFRPPNRKQRYCSVKCARPAIVAARAAELSGEVRTCACCGARFTPKDPRAIYCSAKCSVTMGRRAYAARKKAERQPRLVRCEWCGEVFGTHMPTARFCCKDHHTRAANAAKAKRLTPEIFRYVFCRAA